MSLFDGVLSCGSQEKKCDVDDELIEQTTYECDENLDICWAVKKNAI